MKTAEDAEDADKNVEAFRMFTDLWLRSGSALRKRDFNLARVLSDSAVLV